jgi:hypothetical protein
MAESRVGRKLRAAGTILRHVPSLARL